MVTSTLVKKLSLAAAGAAVMALGAGGAAQAATLDFESVPGSGAASDGLAISNQYASQGVTFSTIEDGVEFSAHLFNDFVDRGFAIWNTTTSDIFGNRGDILRMSFSAAVDAVGFDYNPLGFLGNQTVFNAFDFQGNLLESFTVPGATGISYVPVAFSSSGISRVDIVQPNESWAYTIDNLSFQTQTRSVPEPASVLGLLTVGALGAGSALKRKQGQKA